MNKIQICLLQPQAKKMLKSVFQGHNISFHLYTYSPDPQESAGGAIHRASNYLDLLPKCLDIAVRLNFFIFFYFVFSVLFEI